MVSIILIWKDKKKTKKIMLTLDHMLTDAINGELKETVFDESLLSALETKFAHYLSASVVSAQNLTTEKDRIKMLISDISHQTKTPIANLLLYTELLKEEDLSEEAANNVKILHEQVEKLRFFIDTLVKLSRLESGIIQFLPKENPVQPMFEKVVQQFLPKAEEKGLALQFANTTLSAKFDEKWMVEALCNLVENAIKYTKNGSISISAIPYEMFIRIDVADTGMGITEGEQGMIFSRFYRSQDAAEQEGMGIGLYLTREIIKEQGGYMKVTSEKGKGSTFSVFLPV